MKRTVTALLLLTALAGAVDTLSVPIGPIACIQKDGFARLLARFDLSALPESSYVYYAQIVGPCDIAETTAIETRRLTTPWSRENVRWDYPWRKRGGDYDTTSTALFVYIAGRHKSLAMDVTYHVRDWLRQGHGHNGLLFKDGVTREVGFRRFQGLSEVLAKARLSVIYRAAPVQVHDKDGAAQVPTVRSPR
jgi:hypothetical protein